MAQSLASGNIKPYRFVALDNSNNGSLLQCGSNGIPWGISALGTMLPPLSDGVWNIDNGYAAIAGWPCMVWTFDEDHGAQEIALLCGAGGSVSRGDLVGSDSDGAGITVTTPGNWYAAKCLRTAPPGQLMIVQLLPTVQHY